MKKYINYAAIYFILGCIGGVFYREFTRWNGFTGETKLSVVHTHLFALGMLFFLIAALFVQVKPALLQNRKFRLFAGHYNGGLLLFVCTLLTRGVLEVLNISLSRAVHYSISGIAGFSHILLTVGLAFFFIGLSQEVKD